VRSAPKDLSSATVGGVPWGDTKPLARETIPAVSATPWRSISARASPSPFDGTARKIMSER
jgi:hypothetical protein